MKILIMLVGIISLFISNVNVYAISNFSLSDHLSINPKNLNLAYNSEWKTTDISQYMVDRIGKNEVLLGTGICIGPVYKVNYNKEEIGDIISFCGAVTTDQQGNSGEYAGVNLVSFHGAKMGVYYDPFHKQLAFGFGTSLKSTFDYIKGLW